MFERATFYFAKNGEEQPYHGAKCRTCGECIHCTAACKFVIDRVHMGWKQVRSTPDFSDPYYEKPSSWIVVTESWTRSSDSNARIMTVDFQILARYENDGLIDLNDIDGTVIGTAPTYLEAVRLLHKHLELEERMINADALK